MSIVSEAIKAAHAATAMLHGETVTYVRGDSISIEITDVVRGSTNWDTDAPFAGFRVGERSVDWLIETADLVDSNGTLLEPERGDEIRTANAEVFRVIPMSKDSPLWQWHDRSGQSVRRIFTKERS